MPDRRPRRRPRPARRLVPRIDGLDARQLLSAGVVLHSLGPFLATGVVRPRVSGPAETVNAHASVNDLLAGLLGPDELLSVQSRVEARGTSTLSVLTDQVLGQPFIHSVLSDGDTYTLLTSPAVQALIGFQAVGTDQQDNDTVTYTLEPSNVTIQGDTSLVQVPASGGLAGFFAVVPTVNLRTLNSGLVEVQVPRDLIPSNAPQPMMETLPTGVLGDVFAATGPLLAESLRTSAPLRAPNAPLTVPGLRLVGNLTRSRNFSPAALRPFLRMFRIAVDRNLLALTTLDQARIETGLTQFTEAVHGLNQFNTFQPEVPPPPPNLTRGPLHGTLSVSLGA